MTSRRSDELDGHLNVSPTSESGPLDECLDFMRDVRDRAGVAEATKIYVAAVDEVA